MVGFLGGLVTDLGGDGFGARVAVLEQEVVRILRVQWVVTFTCMSVFQKTILLRVKHRSMSSHMVGGLGSALARGTLVALAGGIRLGLYLTTAILANTLYMAVHGQGGE